MSYTTDKISGVLAFHGDYIFNEAALPNATTATSSAFAFGGAQGGLEIVVVAETEITVAGGQTITYSVVTDDVFAGSYSTTEVSKVIPAATYAEGTVLFRYASNTGTKSYAKLSCVTTADQSSDKHTATIQYISR